MRAATAAFIDRVSGDLQIVSLFIETASREHLRSRVLSLFDTVTRMCVCAAKAIALPGSIISVFFSFFHVFVGEKERKIAAVP